MRHQSCKNVTKVAKTSPKLQKIAKAPKLYYCEFCDYHTSRKSSWEKHLVTKKHLDNSTVTVTGCILSKTPKYRKKYTCEYCKVEYKSRNGLWKHKKVCKYKTELLESSEEEDDVEWDIGEQGPMNYDQDGSGNPPPTPPMI